MPSSTERLDEVPAAAAQRLSNQIARAYRGTYGARTGFGSIVTAVARQMLDAGASPEHVTRALERHVMNHPAVLAHDGAPAATAKTNSTMLVDIARRCVMDVVQETHRG